MTADTPSAPAGDDLVKRLRDPFWNAELAGYPEANAQRHAAAAEIIRLSAELAEAKRQLNEATQKSDEEMLRVKACEHIACGDEGWQKLRNECPSTTAVACLRDAFEQAERDLAEAKRYRDFAEAARDRFAAVIAWLHDEHVTVDNIQMAAWTYEAIGRHRAKQEKEQSRG